MKKFAFPLEKVLAWRRIQTQLAEAELERLHNEQRRAEQKRLHLLTELTRAEQDFVQLPSMGASELAALDAFRRHTGQESAKLKRLAAEWAAKATQQAAVVTEQRRKLRLLEKLKERRLHDWTAEADKETTQLAEESHLARWNPD